MRRHGPVEYEVFLIGVDQARCVGCAECVTICSTGVFEMQGGTAYPVRPESCLNCQGCTGICPTQAITITEI
ncbi:MAG: ferredoxin family protein [Thermoleophilia bacterium]|nr:ferredoxin family protein [Thermoleophilia bacterium]